MRIDDDMLIDAEPSVEPSRGVPVRGRRNAARSKRAKSEVTHSRLCWATTRLIEQKSIRSIKVSEITNLASVSPATFYLYFADVDEAVMAVLDEARADMPDLASLIRAIRPDRLEAGVRAVLVAYLAFWDLHHAVLRIRNLAADEGDVRFREARAQMLGPMLDAFAEKLVELRGDAFDQRRAPPPMAVAAVISGSMERVAVLSRFKPARPELSRRWLFDAELFVICQLLTPRPADD